MSFLQKTIHSFPFKATLYKLLKGDSGSWLSRHDSAKQGANVMIDVEFPEMKLSFHHMRQVSAFRVCYAQFEIFFCWWLASS